MVLNYMGEPSLYSLASVEQWLQNIIDISSEAFATDCMFLAFLWHIYISLLVIIIYDFASFYIFIDG